MTHDDSEAGLEWRRESLMSESELESLLNSPTEAQSKQGQERNREKYLQVLNAKNQEVDCPKTRPRAQPQEM